LLKKAKIVYARAFALAIVAVVAMAMASHVCFANPHSTAGAAAQVQAKAEFYSAVPAPEIAANAGMLVDAETGQILFSMNPDERLAPASITKIMTMLIVMEHVDEGKISLDDTVVVSREASMMGGSQVYLKEKEQASVEDLMAATAIRSANDASYALAEVVSGTADAFVELMNARAAELGMSNTHFMNPEGLDDPNHYTTARDIGIMSRELLAHPKILEWTSTWIGKMRGGTYDLFNTNRLIKEYEGADGLKTGQTDTAGWCLVGTAQRGGTRLLSVVLGAASDGDRVGETSKLLDYGFQKFERTRFIDAGNSVGMIHVPSAAKQDVTAVAAEDLVLLSPRGLASEIEVHFEPVQQEISAPIEKGQPLGRAVVRMASGEELGSTLAVAEADVPRANAIVRAWRAIVRFFSGLFGGRGTKA
jgi:D-alanyl-D-alanine carboxypeptidase (penicillin-binding protein 5/6)